MDNFKNRLSKYFIGKAPKLPAKAKDVLVMIAPWLTILSLAAFIPWMFSWISLQETLRQMGVPMPNSSIGFALNISAAVVMAIAIPGLFRRKSRAWNLMFAASWISILGQLFAANIVSAVVTFLIDMYLLFQIRDRYQA